jgi:hypothetical protein
MEEWNNYCVFRWKQGWVLEDVESRETAKLSFLPLCEDKYP